MKKILMLSTLMLFITGCIPSLHPIYDKDTLYFTPDILGQWEVKDDEKTIWEFRKNKDQSYEMIVKEDQDTSYFEMHLAKIGKEIYMDLYPDSQSEGNSDFANIHYMPVHTFARITISGTKEFKFEYINYEKLESLLKKGKIKIKHEKVDGGYVLTASTKELQEFIKKFSKVPDAFDEPTIFDKINL